MNDDEKTILDIKNKLAQEHNWSQQEKHYLENQKHFVENQKHWTAQQKQWKWVVILGFIAILINGFKSLWSN